MATHVYLARWVWNTTETKWEAPLRTQCTGAIDFRSNTQCGTAGGTGGWGFFSYPTTVTISGSTYLGVDFASINNTRKTAINNNLGVTLTINESLDRVINKLLTANGVADGSTKWRPLKIGKDRKVNISFAGLQLGIGSVQDDEAGFLASMEVRKSDYARMRSSGVPLSELRKWNGKLGLIVPPEFVNDGSDPPETIISDDFNRANQALDTGGIWTEVIPTNWTVTSNQVTVGTANIGALARHNTALSSDNHKASVDATAFGTNGTIGAAIRCSTDASPNQDFYVGIYSGGASNNHSIRKVVNATATELGTPSTVTVSLPDTTETEASGSTLTIRHNGTFVQSLTDTSITGNLRCGLYLRRVGDTLDNFTASDLPVAAGRSWGYILG
jgi:hypothetical protein